ncbi:MAG TPA: multiheme c-type cytochrome [Oligoflexia bacterium]|nr:multiheme c-type cytochrome [Oligoflexia bacterium]HMP47527.1 multiheme c-type cytochrome [Oligoflexia bacterium]
MKIETLKSQLIFLFALLVYNSVCIADSGGTDHILENVYLGVSSCASSVCHGSTGRSESNVLQNEYRTWFKHDAHHKAYETLLSSDSKIIGSHLGIDAPERAKECLQCHSTYVPEFQRGDKFRLDDGVGCESCHGAAGNYIKSHTQKERSHEENKRDGLTDLANPKIRSEVCLSCHQGSGEQTVDHRLIGAGHPRLSFELDTYSINQPMHWQIDSDYLERKGGYQSGKFWALGQVYRAKSMLSLMLSYSPKISGTNKKADNIKNFKSGVLPELSQYYCYNCHHSLKEEQWKNRQYGGHPGELRLNISSLKITSLVLLALGYNGIDKLESEINDLHHAHLEGRDLELIKKIIKTLETDAIPFLDNLSFNKENTLKIFKEVTNYSVNTHFLPYEIAEQCAMALSALSSQYKIITGSDFLSGEIKILYKSLRHEKDFKPEEFTKKAKDIEIALLKKEPALK